jgi:MFS family permease
VALVISGRLSDKVGRRKPLVIAASLLMAVSMAVPLLWPTLIALFIETVGASLAFGIYIPVDQALFIDVLPD